MLQVYRPIADAKLDQSLVKGRKITRLHIVTDLVAHLTLASKRSSTVVELWPCYDSQLEQGRLAPTIINMTKKTFNHSGFQASKP